MGSSILNAVKDPCISEVESYTPSQISYSGVDFNPLGQIPVETTIHIVNTTIVWYILLPCTRRAAWTLFLAWSTHFTSMLGMPAFLNGQCFQRERLGG